MIENLQDDFYELENKQAKSAKFDVNTRQDEDGKKCSKTLFKVLESQTIL